MRPVVLRTPRLVLSTPVAADAPAVYAHCQDAELQRLLAVGADKARRASEPTLEAMYENMGFVKPGAGRFFGAARPRGL